MRSTGQRLQYVQSWPPSAILTPTLSLHRELITQYKTCDNAADVQKLQDSIISSAEAQRARQRDPGKQSGRIVRRVRPIAEFAPAELGTEDTELHRNPNRPGPQTPDAEPEALLDVES